MGNERILNWYPRKRSVVEYLKHLFGSEVLESGEDVFVTMRLGSKWADQLYPGDLIAISISENPEQPNILGYAEILETSKTHVGWLRHDEDLAKNIGAKTRIGIAKAMSEIYQKEVLHTSTVSMLRLKIKYRLY